MSSYIKTSDHLTIVFDSGESSTIYTTEQRYSDIVSALRLDWWATVHELCFPVIKIQKQLNATGVNDRCKIVGGIVHFDGMEMHSTLTSRMLEMLDDGFDIKPMMVFLENLMENPSHRAVNELYGFMEKSDLPITSDGHFLAYKRIKLNWKDQHTGTIDNSIGSTPSMPRNQVDENKDQTCSSGLHFCSREYLNSYGSSEGGRVVVVKINPRDVVSIPSDYNNAKGRCCKYEVISELKLESEEYHSLPIEKIEGSYSPEPIEELYDSSDDDFSLSDLLSGLEDVSLPRLIADLNNEARALKSEETVKQYSLSSNFVINVFDSVKAAAAFTGVDPSSIRKVLNGKRNSAGGFGWK